MPQPRVRTIPPHGARRRLGLGRGYELKSTAKFWKNPLPGYVRGGTVGSASTWSSTPQCRSWEGNWSCPLTFQFRVVVVGVPKFPLVLVEVFKTRFNTSCVSASGGILFTRTSSVSVASATDGVFLHPRQLCFLRMFQWLNIFHPRQQCFKRQLLLWSILLPRQWSSYHLHQWWNASHLRQQLKVIKVVSQNRIQQRRRPSSSLTLFKVVSQDRVRNAMLSSSLIFQFPVKVLIVEIIQVFTQDKVQRLDVEL